MPRRAKPNPPKSDDLPLAEWLLNAARDDPDEWFREWAFALVEGDRIEREQMAKANRPKRPDTEPGK